MTIDEFYNKLCETGHPVGYIVFAEKQSTPFILYGFDADNSVMADNRHYFPVKNYWVELYSAKPEFALQAEIEAIFIINQIPYIKTFEDFVETDKVFLCRWEIQLIGG